MNSRQFICLQYIAKQASKSVVLIDFRVMTNFNVLSSRGLTKTGFFIEGRGQEYLLTKMGSEVAKCEEYTEATRLLLKLDQERYSKAMKI